MTLVEDVRPRAEARPIKPEGAQRGEIRGDIEGLRAVAVLTVLLYHAGAPFLPGGFIGVDVFFVISGFLITTLLVRELVSRGTVSLPRFYARRAKRLLPASAAVLVFVVLATPLLLPRTRWVGTAWDVVASSLYGVNWRLAAQSVDYLAAGEAASPVQHFWSLAVEEQFYLVWPLLLLLATWRARALRRRHHHLHGRVGGHPGTTTLTRSLLLGLAVIAVPSLAWSIHLTATSAGPAYFVTTTRVWELAIGGGVAIGAAGLAALPRGVASAMGWAGLASVVGTAFILTTATPFPGWVALVPTLGTAAVIASGPASGRSGPVRILGSAPMRWVGGLSYSLYLWHWPLLVLATARLGERLTLSQGLAVVLASFVPAYLSRRYVEEPIRRARPLAARPMLALRLGLACTLAGVLGGLALLAAVWSASPPPASSYVPHVLNDKGVVSTGTPRFGAEVLGTRPRGNPLGAATDEVSSITPDVLKAKLDLDKDCDITTVKGTGITTCLRGNPDSKLHVLVLGDSHAHQWMPALASIAEAEDWSMVSHFKASCPFTQGEVGTRTESFTSCNQWNREVRRTLATEARPDLVILSSRKYSMVENGRVLTGPANAAKVAGAQRAAIREFTDAGVPVAVIRDTPAAPVNIPDCVASHLDDLTFCAPPRRQALQGSEQVAAVRGVKGAHLLDLSDAICPGDPCAPVIGGVLVWRDDDHLTRTYVQSLTPRLQALLRPLAQPRLSRDARPTPG
ncbi:MAG TPA: acyltransferase family protein [Dermatophilaceae bacterium]|nr:acyltransferase family protein [Dermatophilaceae bacterium]